MTQYVTCIIGLSVRLKQLVSYLEHTIEKCVSEERIQFTMQYCQRAQCMHLYAADEYIIKKIIYYIINTASSPHA